MNVVYRGGIILKGGRKKHPSSSLHREKKNPVIVPGNLATPTYKGENGFSFPFSRPLFLAEVSKKSICCRGAQREDDKGGEMMMELLTQKGSKMEGFSHSTSKNVAQHVYHAVENSQRP